MHGVRHSIRNENPSKKQSKRPMNVVAVFVRYRSDGTGCLGGQKDAVQKHAEQQIQRKSHFYLVLIYFRSKNASAVDSKPSLQASQLECSVFCRSEYFFRWIHPFWITWTMRRRTKPIFPEEGSQCARYSYYSRQYLF